MDTSKKKEVGSFQNVMLSQVAKSELEKERDQMNNCLKTLRQTDNYLIIHKIAGCLGLGTSSSVHIMFITLSILFP